MRGGRALRRLSPGGSGPGSLRSRSHRATGVRLTYKVEVKRYDWPDGGRETLIVLDNEVLDLADAGDKAYGERLLAAAQGDVGA